MPMIGGPQQLALPVNAALLMVLAGFLLLVGKPVLLPILAAVIAVYVLISASEALRRVPLIGRLPPAMRRLLVLLAFLLTAAQMIVGNVVEPQLIGRRVNLSPFVVLVSLAVWGALRGSAGALLAVPLTSILFIVFSSFEPTRPIAILMADRIEQTQR